MTVRKAAVGMNWHCESQHLEGVVLLARSSGQEGLPSSFTNADQSIGHSWQRQARCHKMAGWVHILQAARVL